MIQGIFFDFDGVVMDSMDLKLDSYCHALERFGFSRGDIRNLQYLHTGLSRYKVLVHIYETLSGQPITDHIRRRCWRAAVAGVGCCSGAGRGVVGRTRWQA